MTSDNGIHVGKPPFFDYWKTRMSAHLKAMSRKLWRLVSDGYVVLDPIKLSPLDEENEILNDQGVNVLFSALDKCPGKPWHYGTPKVLQQRVRAPWYPPLQGDPGHHQK